MGPGRHPPLAFAPLLQLGRRVVAHGLQQPVAIRTGRIVRLDQAFVHQRIEEFEHLEFIHVVARADRLGGGHVEAAYEDRKTGQHRLLGRRQQVIRPVDQRLECVLAGHGGA